MILKFYMFMRYRIILIGVWMLLGVSAFGQEFRWEVVDVDGSMTGCVSPSKDNVADAVGHFEGGKYIAPDGKVYRKNSSVARTARAVIDAQPKMARVKDVIAYSTAAMSARRPESALSNWFIDLLMKKTAEYSGRKVDVGITNFGGIRIEMPQGDVILDDMLSMFPFKNQLVYAEIKGVHLRTILEKMAAGRFEVIGGVRVVVEDGRLLSAEIDGLPLDDDKVYGLATISFLLNGGDGFALQDNALSIKVFEDINIIDAVLDYVGEETAAGRPIEYKEDGRVTILGKEDRK